MEETRRTKDRKLGDEWANWDGKIMHPSEIRVGATLFLVLLFASLLVLFAAAFFFLYLVSPRLAQYSDTLPPVVGAVLAAAAFVALLWYVDVLIIMKTNMRRLLSGPVTRLFLSLSGFAGSMGDRIGISRDKLGHSFIRVSNALALASLKSSRTREVLLLLPRCLAREARSRIMEMCSGYRLDVRTVGGGEAARTAVLEVRPDAVIGVACERDLVSGIRDVAPRIPVLGIPNIRPQGPCKGTHVDYEELERAIRFLCERLGAKEKSLS